MTSELKLDEGSDTVVVQGGIKVAFNAGGITVNVQGATITVDKNGTVAMQTAANDSLFVPPVASSDVSQLLPAKAALRIGDLDGGGVYVGVSAENGKPLHAALADLPDYKTYEEALAAAEQLKAVHPTAHVPTPKELDKNLFDNRYTGHLNGTFNTSGSSPGSVYRSSASYFIILARVQWFDGGSQGNNYRSTHYPVRLVW